MLRRFAMIALLAAMVAALGTGCLFRHRNCETDRSDRYYDDRCR